MTTAALLADATRQLKSAGIDNARLDARVLLAHASGSDSWTPDEEPGEAERDRFESLLARRVAREPLAYIIGHKEFWSLEFDVGPGALVPRPETETLIEELTRLKPDRSAPLELLDLGTGSGCLLVAALSEYSRAKGTGIDSSEDAVKWARRNVAKFKLNERCVIQVSDWSRKIEGRFDAILSNPPYIRAADVAALAPEVSRYEPVPALDGGADGFAAYREIAARIGAHLKPDGVFLAEIGAGQSEQVKAILQTAGLEVVKIVEDLARIPRCVVGRPRNREA